ncbi:porin [Photobacterium phosphoreum]|uniref:porin n=1 Tax=Photobacterium phosphoreum TaxID=659 RepID=UPI0007F87AC7|nr:porin [Photobacterium phosphoreum]MCD9479543.1 porin [Photobacterium phosphoreum]MCD9509270.1 porin [Photobacterium phosphoreum]OBU38351.1 porin [Photobacterium phosphoreum]PSU79213.1 porin [Photobacterium phosphoreum]
MKKSLLALAVLTAAGSANAGINLYDANGVKVDLSGAVEVQLYDNFEKHGDSTIRLDDGDLALNATVAVSENLNVVSGTAFKYESRDLQNYELWAGFSGDFGTLTFGRQLLVSDDSGIGKDYELGAAQLNWVQTEGDRVAKYVYDNGTFYTAVSHEMDNKNSTTITDGRVGFRTGGLDIRAYGYDGKRIGYQGLVESGDKVDGKPVVTPGKDGDDIRGYNLEAQYAMGAINLAASFGQIEYKDLTEKTKQTIDLYEINGSYKIDNTTMALGYVRGENEGDHGNVINNVYANVTQQLHSNVRAYVEIGYADDKNNELEDFGYVAGLEVKF